MLTVEQVQFLLRLIRQEYGPGYSDQPEVGKLQAMLSIMGEAADKAGRHSPEIPPAPPTEAPKRKWKV